MAVRKRLALELLKKDASPTCFKSDVRREEKLPIPFFVPSAQQVRESTSHHSHLGHPRDIDQRLR